MSTDDLRVMSIIRLPDGQYAVRSEREVSEEELPKIWEAFTMWLRLMEPQR